MSVRVAIIFDVDGPINRAEEDLERALERACLFDNSPSITFLSSEETLNELERMEQAAN